MQVLSEFSACVERASIDEAYIDLTSKVEEILSSFTEQNMFADEVDIIKTLPKESLQTNFVLGQESSDSWLEMITSSELIPTDDLRLAIGAEIVGRMREAVFQKTGFRCSAGIAHNKVI
jgi:DNA polymerase eta